MEIGSEFWKYNGNLDCDNFNFWNIGTDRRFMLSGRTAIYFVLEDILKEREIKSAYMPSYVCDSILQPFEDKGINIEFYDVYYNNGLKYNIDLDYKCDIFFAMNYFGYSKSNMETIVENFKNREIIVIEDITHSIFSKKQYSNESDYLIASLRKWFPVASGGLAVNMNSKFNSIETAALKDLSNKKEAMELKKEYIDEINSYERTKEKFLNLFNDFNRDLKNDYENYLIDEESLEILMKIDLEELKRKRKANARAVYDGLCKNVEIEFLEEYNEEDVLLFVPIIMKKELRDELRKYLTQRKIYLPIHWPVPANCEDNMSNIYERELSLVCDQRYSVEEIQNYINVIKEFISRY